MDCGKFESTLLDDLYGELDEVTSAAAKRHAAGCSRCASLATGLRATKQLSALPFVEPSADLEDRILAAAKEAQKVVPIGRRVARALSSAGSWAMRPQTAMAALFLLMIGTSAVLLRSRKGNTPSASAVTITQQGAPAVSAAPSFGERDNLDTKTAAAAHGPERARAEATPSPPPSPKGTGDEGFALRKGGVADRGGSAQRDLDNAITSASTNANTNANRNASTNSGAVAGAPGASALPNAPPMNVQQRANEAPQAQLAGPTVDFPGAMAAYRARNYQEATRAFDALGRAGDASAALWGARSVRDGSGCAAAVSRFDEVASRSFGTTPGYDATLEGARCYRALGQGEEARVRLTKLLAVAEYASRAQAELGAMAPRASKAAPKAAPTQMIDDVRPQSY